MHEQTVQARLESGGQQVVDVTVDGGYQPDSIRAFSGLPLRLVFHRQDDDACSERVVFSAPRLDRRLAATGSTSIDLPAQSPGEIRFTCGMGRYRGRIELVDERHSSILTRARDRATRVEARFGTARVAWICSLALIALVAVVALESPAAIPVAGAALLTWVAACLWASRRSARSISET